MKTEPNTKSPFSTVRCAIYTRSATIEQGTDPLGDQELTCRAAAAQHPGWVILDHHVYRDGGLSGSARCARPGLGSLLEAATSPPHPFDCVVVTDTARVGRDIRDVADILDTLARHGVDVYFASEGLDSRLADFQPALHDGQRFNGGKATANLDVGTKAKLPKGLAGELRWAIYARYSACSQHDASIEKQLQNCREAADRVDLSRSDG